MPSTSASSSSSSWSLPNQEVAAPKTHQATQPVVDDDDRPHHQQHHAASTTTTTTDQRHGKPFDGMMCLCTMEDITIEDGNYGE